MGQVISLWIVLLGALYFLPTVIAMGRRNFGGIAFLNLFLGWTVIVWVICFVWACSSPRERSYAAPDRIDPRVWPAGKCELTVHGESMHNLDGTSRQLIIAGLSPGDPVQLVREPGNPHDQNAVRVDSPKGCIGYIARDEAMLLAPALDAGRLGAVTIKDILGGDSGRPSRGVWLLADIAPVNKPIGRTDAVFGVTSAMASAGVVLIVAGVLAFLAYRGEKKVAVEVPAQSQQSETVNAPEASRSMQSTSSTDDAICSLVFSRAIARGVIGAEFHFESGPLGHASDIYWCIGNGRNDERIMVVFRQICATMDRAECVRISAVKDTVTNKFLWQARKK